MQTPLAMHTVVVMQSSWNEKMGVVIYTTHNTTTTRSGDSSSSLLTLPSADCVAPISPPLPFRQAIDDNKSVCTHL